MVDMRSIASIITDPTAIFIVVGGLALWAACSAWLLHRGTARLASALAAAHRRLERAKDAAAFASSYESISAEMGADPILGPRWREYRDSLVLPRDVTRPVRATARASAWFDISLLRAPGIHMDVRYHAALPNLLVGAGLLFTFIGLAAALGTAGGIATASQQAERTNALRTLLDTASFKFVTSLFGLALSIAYALYRKRRMHVAEQALDAFLAALEARVPLLTPAALQQEANELLGRQSTQLETFSTDLAVSLGAAFDRAFDERLGEHIAPLTQAMQRLAEGMGTRNEEAIKAMLDGFLKGLQGGAGDHMEGVNASLRGLGSQLEGLQKSLGQAAVHMANSANAMGKRMSEGAESALTRITDQMSGLTENLRAMTEQMRTAGAEAGRDMAVRIEAASAGFVSSADRVAGSLEQAAKQTGVALERGAEEAMQRIGATTEGLALQIAGMTAAADGLVTRIAELNRAAHDAAAPLSATASDLNTAGQAVRSALEPLNQVARSASHAVEQIADAAQRFEGAQAATRSLVESLNAAAQRFEGVDKELASTLKELQTGLHGFTTRVGTFVGETDQNLAKAATQLGGLVKGLQATLDDFDSKHA